MISSRLFMMLGYLLLFVCAGGAFGGVSVQMPYLSPAGVTYNTVPHAVPSPLHYSNLPATAVRTSIAYGNRAFIDQHFGARLAPLPHGVAPVAAAPLAVAPAVAPVAVASPLFRTVQHVPAVAQVPVTKIEAQPAVIQNVVDVAKAKVATRKLEIRRPAIQKEFYDVEERIVVRPAGSAVLELDQPISKSQRGPTVIQPAVHAVTAAPVAVHAAPLAVSPAFRALPLAYATHSYPIQGPHGIAVAGSPVISHEGSPTPQPQPEYPQEPSQPEQPQPEYPEPQPQPEYPQPQPQPEYPQPQPQPEYPQPQPQPEYPQPQPQPEYPQPQPQPQQDFSQGFPQSDDSDSVSIDNPELSRFRSQPAPSRQPERPNARSQFERIIPQPLDEAMARSQQEALQQQQLIVRYQTQAQEQIVSRLRAQIQEQEQLLARAQQQAQAQEQLLARSRTQEAQLEARSRAQEEVLLQQRAQQEQMARSRAQEQSARSRNQEQERSEEQSARSRPEPQQRDRTEQQLDIEISSRSGLNLPDIRQGLARAGDVIPSVRLSPEQSLSNQERLIALLTARGGVSEVRGPSSRHQVRTRVLSVTPAPENARASDEKVNTRRIVVNRPIQTVQEVDIVEPFTKIERVAVHQPALIKTARLGVAHVPTAVPVHGFAHAGPALL